jgi:hypothetical protein
MNYMRKKSAVTNYGHLLNSDFSNQDEVKAALAQDPLHFEKDEIDEIIMEMIDPTPKKEKADKKETQDTKNETPVEEVVQPPQARKKPEPTDQPTMRTGRLKHYYKHKVKQVYETIVLRGRKEDILKGFKKEGVCLQVTQIEEKHADILNQQVPNTMYYYFAEGEDDFLPAENFF